MAQGTAVTAWAAFALALGLAGFGPGAAHAMMLPAESAADQAIYAARYAAYSSGAVYSYAPLEAVPGAPDAKPLPLAEHPAISAEARAAAAAYAAANHSSALLVWRRGALEQAVYFGDARADTPLVSKSLSKPLSAIVIGRAIKLGYIKSLDQPVSDFITEWRGGPKAGIKIRHLLDMRSGLLPQGPAPTADDILNRAYLDPHHDEILIRDYPLVHPPGVRFDYANAVADLVAIVIERAAHQRYARFVSEAVLGPLNAQGGQVWVDRPDGLAHSACCMLAPAETWLRLGILLLNDGRWNGQALLPPGYVEAMKRGTPQNPLYGLGVYGPAPYTKLRGFNNPDLRGPLVLHGEPYQARDLFLFDGNADQVVYIIPSEGLVILRMGETPPASPPWDNAILPNLLLRGLTRQPGWAPQPGPRAP